MDSASFANKSKKFPAYRELIGAFTHDLERDQFRVKPFLRRNMSRVLAHHSKRKAIAKNPEPPVRSAETQIETQLQSCRSCVNGDLESVSDSLEGTGIWGKPASPAMGTVSADCLVVKGATSHTNDSKNQPRRSLRRLQEAQLQDTEAVLTIRLKNIRKKLNFNAPRLTDDQRPVKRQKTATIKCQCSLTIWDNRATLTEPEPIIRKTETCYIKSKETPPNGFSVDIELENDFQVEVNELKIPLDKNNESVLGLSEAYFMELKIIPTKSDVDWPPIPILGKSDGDQLPGLNKTIVEKLQGSLVARYLKLPQAIPAQTPLSVFFLHEGRTYRTKYGLEVDSYWGKPQIIPVIKQEPGDQTVLDQLFPDPSKAGFKNTSEEDDDYKPGQHQRSKARKVKHSRPLVKIYYVFDGKGDIPKEFRRAMVEGFCCPACPSQLFPTLMELRFHFVNSHLKYQFTIEETRQDEQTKELSAVVMKIDPIPPPKPSRSNRIGPLDEFKMEWLTPYEPFDLEAYLMGDERWAGGENRNRRHTAVSIQDPLSRLREQHHGFLPVRHVPPFRGVANRKRYRIIRLRTNSADKETMYTSVAHRPLRLSEDARSESDDDMDNDWYLQKHLESLDIEAKSQKRSPVEHEFEKRWDTHRVAEGLSHSRYISDCLIRFVKAQKSWLAGLEAQQVFLSFVNELKDRKQINETVLIDCTQLVYAEEQGQTLPSSTVFPSMNPNQRNAPPNLKDGYQDTQDRINHLLALPEETCGICIKKIKSAKDSIRCTDPACETAGVLYHLKCTKEQRDRRLDWICDICKERNRLVKGKGRAL